MAYFNYSDLYEAEHKTITAVVSQCKAAADEGGTVVSSNYFLRMIEGIIALTAELTKGESDG